MADAIGRSVLSLTNGLRTGLTSFFGKHVLYPRRVVAFGALAFAGRSMVKVHVNFGPSMLPTVQPHDVLLITRCNAGALNAGDIITANFPPVTLCKRVVYLPNTVVLASVSSTSGSFKNQFAVPKDTLWLEGDNRDHSCDSRHLGPIPFAQVEGKVVFRLFPLARFGRVGT